MLHIEPTRLIITNNVKRALINYPFVKLITQKNQIQTKAQKRLMLLIIIRFMLNISPERIQQRQLLL